MPSKESDHIKVYGKPGCVQCQYTCKELEKKQLSYQYIDISVNPVAEEHVKSLGFTSVPVVEAPGQQPWAGFKPDKIRSFKHG